LGIDNEQERRYKGSESFFSLKRPAVGGTDVQGVASRAAWMLTHLSPVRRRGRNWIRRVHNHLFQVAKRITWPTLGRWVWTTKPSWEWTTGCREKCFDSALGAYRQELLRYSSI
jgi:hypothetical protein